MRETNTINSEKPRTDEAPMSEPSRGIHIVEAAHMSGRGKTGKKKTFKFPVLDYFRGDGAGA